jgi:hypothetical protein
LTPLGTTGRRIWVFAELDDRLADVELCMADAADRLRVGRSSSFASKTRL